MPEHRRQKNRIRTRMEETGESYLVARRKLFDPTSPMPQALLSFAALLAEEQLLLRTHPPINPLTHLNYPFSQPENPLLGFTPEFSFPVTYSAWADYNADANLLIQGPARAGKTATAKALLFRHLAHTPGKAVLIATNHEYRAEVVALGGAYLDFATQPLNPLAYFASAYEPIAAAENTLPIIEVILDFTAEYSAPFTLTDQHRDFLVVRLAHCYRDWAGPRHNPNPQWADLFHRISSFDPRNTKRETALLARLELAIDLLPQYPALSTPIPAADLLGVNLGPMTGRAALPAILAAKTLLYHLLHSLNTSPDRLVLFDDHEQIVANPHLAPQAGSLFSAASGYRNGVWFVLDEPTSPDKVIETALIYVLLRSRTLTKLTLTGPGQATLEQSARLVPVTLTLGSLLSPHSRSGPSEQSL